MGDLRAMIMVELSGKAITFEELMDRMDFTGMPERKNFAGTVIGYHGPVMVELMKLIDDDVIVELTSGTSMPVYRMSLIMVDERMAS